MSSWIERLEILRTIDSVIDFSRATAQLRLLIALNEHAYTVTELVELTGLRRKTILDALRKLELKGLVAREGDKFYLTERGRMIYHALRSVIKGEEGISAKNLEILSYKPSLYDIYNDLISVVYMLQVLKILGRVKDHSMPLTKLANRLKISPHTLDAHLQRFSQGHIQLFIRYKEGERVYYKLTNLGIDLYKRLYPKEKSLLNKIKSVLASLLRH